VAVSRSGDSESSGPRIRLTWILHDPTHSTWRKEFTVDGEHWSLIEEYSMEATPA
jgi:hypothetical protein